MTDGENTVAIDTLVDPVRLSRLDPRRPHH
jgi:hypothetical protein